MYAVRCKETNLSFRRSGVLFPGHEWTILPALTPEQAAEPMLIVLEVDSADDPRLFEPLRLPAPEPIAEPIAEPSIAESNASQPDTATLVEENTILRSSLETLQREFDELHITKAALQDRVEAHEKALGEFQEVNQALGEERDTLQRQVETLSKAVIVPDFTGEAEATEQSVEPLPSDSTEESSKKPGTKSQTSK